jgi:hypothetical protein
MIGDSGMFSATPALAAGLDAAGWRGRDRDPGIGPAAHRPAANGMVDGRGQYHVDLTIVMLGSWDLAEQETGAGAYCDLVARSVAPFRSGDGKVLWLSALPGGESDAGARPVLRGARGRYPGVVDYLDVRSALAARRQLAASSTGALRQLDGWHLCQDAPTRSRPRRSTTSVWRTELARR